jgi:polar amino acid transport system ATP-binding protein
VIAVEKLTKKFDGRTVVDAVSLAFERGKVSAIFGPSGGGKSTLLRCINGLEVFDSGRVRVGDLELGPNASDASLLRNVRLKVGMVFQQFGLFAHMTALANVMEAPIHVKGVSKEEARDRARKLLDKVGLAKRREAFPRELSGGEQQRVAIARALAMEPEALLLDEPTSSLDPELKEEVVRVLAALAKEGATMVVVTHEAALVREITDRCFLLREGRVAAEGTASEVLRKEPPG